MRPGELPYSSLIAWLPHRRYPSTSRVAKAAVGPSGCGLPRISRGFEGALVLATPPLAVNGSAEQAVTNNIRLRNMPLLASMPKTFPSLAVPLGPAPSHSLGSVTEVFQWIRLIIID